MANPLTKKVTQFLGDKLGGMVRVQSHAAMVDFLNTGIFSGGHHLGRMATLAAGFDSGAYLNDHMHSAIALSTPELLTHSLDRRDVEGGLILEFGVWSGATIRVIARHAAPTQVHGFDTFEGIEANWHFGFPMKHFDRGGEPPSIPANVRLHKGLFQDTLVGFLSDHRRPVSFAHIDSDIYESAAYVLSTLGERIVPGSVIQFDEYFNYPGWRHHEFRAWQEFVAARRVEYTYLGFNPTGHAVSVIVDSIRGVGRPVRVNG